MSKEILVVGDVMLDCYIKGESLRLSPEAPVPVVSVNEEFYNLGGAANVAQNISILQTNCSVLGVIGDDFGGNKISQLFSESNIQNHCVIPDDKMLTTVKTRVVSGHQQIVRFDKEQIYNGANFLADQLRFLLQKQESDFIVVSDYAKGVCSQELMTEILRYTAKVLVDPKGNNWDKYRGAFLVKPNLKELSVIAGEPIANTDAAVAKYGKAILEQYEFTYLLVTRGSKGMTLIAKDKVSHHQVDQIRVYDVSGAGDTVVAVLAVLLNEGYSIDYAVNAANEAGRYVVAQPFTYAINRSELDAILKEE